MRESVEFRIPEEHAQRFLRPDEAKWIGEIARAVVAHTGDPLYERIGSIQRQFSEQGKSFYYGWSIERKYSRRELEEAELLHLKITAVFEPAGEMCGTVYDERVACSFCGAGRRQETDLILDLRKAPKTRDIARTIADEWIISQRLAELLVDARITGFGLRPVRHKARYQDDAIDLSRYPTGQEILRRAAAAGAPHPTGEFGVWLNRPEQAELWRQLREEYSQTKQRRADKSSRPVPVWHQLVVTSPPVCMVEPTRFGITPHEEDAVGEYRCPLGHVSGLNILSEAWIQRDGWDGNDIVRTQQLVGARRGVLVPTPLLLISLRLWRLLEKEKIKGYEVEVAHPV